MTTSNVAAQELSPGQWVEVRSLEEIRLTLDPRGSLDDLPFMPEMEDYCGKRFLVAEVVVQVCIDGAWTCRPESAVRAFRGGQVIVLKDLRCSGTAHGSCQQRCVLFWKSAWLRSVPDGGNNPQWDSRSEPCSQDGLAWCAPPMRADGTYFCQSSEIVKATCNLTALARWGAIFRGLRVGNYGVTEIARRLSIWVFWRARTKVFGEHLRLDQAKTPVGSLDLQPGELVEVRSKEEIVRTLDAHGRNRGLHFSIEMTKFLGKRYRVLSRVENGIVEGKGIPRKFRNTVILEGVFCDSSYYTFGGCPRRPYHYWREIWLKRVVDRG